MNIFKKIEMAECRQFIASFWLFLCSVDYMSMFQFARLF
jgi:hypothetical protein